MTTETAPQRTVANAVTASVLGIWAGVAITTLSPRAVPYVAAGLVILAGAVAVMDRIRPSKDATDR